MAAAGMHMGSHSRSHRELVGRDRDLLVFELLGSRESLQAFTGVAPRALAWPFGNYDALALQIAAGGRLSNVREHTPRDAAQQRRTASNWRGCASTGT